MNRPIKRASNYLNIFLNRLPDDQKKKVLVERKIKQVYEQFTACVEPFIADHVNSIYLINEPKDVRDSKLASDVSRETFLKLTVYVDNSLIAAELNAQRELIILKYRELFDLTIDEMIIKISRGAYRDNYPLRKKDTDEVKSNFHQLSPEEEADIEYKTANISDNDIRASFQRVLKATKEHPLKD